MNLQQCLIPPVPSFECTLRKERALIEIEAKGDRAAASATGGAVAALAQGVPAAGSAFDGSPVAFLFPGQGSQAVGMLAAAKDLPKVKDMLKQANEVFGFDLLDICLNGEGCLGWAACLSASSL